MHSDKFLPLPLDSCPSTCALVGNHLLENGIDQQILEN
jgi:hypothetical protein